MMDIQTSSSHGALTPTLPRLSRLITVLGPDGANEVVFSRLLQIPLAETAELLLCRPAITDGGHEERAREELDSLVAHVRQGHPGIDLRVRTQRLGTSCAGELCGLIRRHRAELVVLGRGGPAGASDSPHREWRALLNEVTCDLLVVSSRRPCAYRRLLVAVELTSEAHTLARHGLRLSSKLESVLAFHEADASYALVLRRMGASPRRIVAFREERVRDVEQRLAALLEPYRRQGFLTSVRIGLRELGESMTEVLDERTCDLAVVGKRVHTGIARLLMPHSAEAALEHGDADVLIVPLSAEQRLADDAGMSADER